MDVWQCALEDVGPAGLDKGKGGKYLILPPGYKNKAPTGYRINLFLGKPKRERRGSGGACGSGGSMNRER